MPIQHSPTKSVINDEDKDKNLPKENETHITNNDDEEYEIYIDYPTGRLAALTRKRNEILNKMHSKDLDSTDEVKKLFKEFQQKIANFAIACNEQLNKEGVATDVKIEFINWRDQHMKINNNFELETAKWLKNIEVQDTINPEDSVSNILPKDYAFHLDTEKIHSDQLQLKNCTEEKNKQLKQAEEKYASEQKKFEELKEKLKKQHEKIEILKRQKEKGMVEVETASQVRDGGPLEFLQNWKKESELARNLQLKQGENLSSDGNLHDFLKKQNEISLMMAQLQTRALLPCTEPESFDGSDPTSYKSFILSFDRTISQRCTDNADKFYFLLKYTKGKPHELVASCNFKDPKIGYTKARKLLEEHYGNEFNIANSYLEKLENWEPIEAENGEALNDFALFLSHCATMMQDMTALNQLNSLREIRDIVKKLPWNLRTKFREQAGNKICDGEAITFQFLSDFVNKQAQILTLPLIGDIKDDKRRSKSNSTKNVETWKTNKKSFHANLSTNKEKDQICPCCKKNHPLDICFFFLKKTMEQRENFIKEKKLCFGCLHPTSAEHSAKTCKRRNTCKKCSKKHPTSLHREQQQSSKDKSEIENSNSLEKDKEKSKEETKEIKEATSHYAEVKNPSQKLAYPSVLVNVRIKGQTTMVTTYMGMDPYCSDSFMDFELLKKLRVEGKPVEMTLTTMEKSKSLSNYLLVNDLEILSVDSEIKTVLSQVYAKQEWPFKIEDSPSPEECEKYMNLRNLPIKYENKNIGLLVGISRPDIIKPRDIVNTTRRGPYATRHLFGWAINGPTTSRGLNKKTNCFHAKVENFNELNLDEKIEKCFIREFEEEYDEIKVSLDDKKWLEKVESSIIKLPDNHYQIDLPFKYNNISLPCNYDQAYHGLHRLKKKFEKDEEYFKSYRDFIALMRESNYAEVVPVDEIDTDPGKVWYLMHFAVPHKQKNKLRVVFDCSLKYQNICLNDTLLQGPDLANNLVGVILRFRQRKIAFSADIQKNVLSGPSIKKGCRFSKIPLVS